MDNDKQIWIGSYSTEQNAYDIDLLSSVCASNERIYKDGCAGYAPLCFGFSREDVLRKIKKIREHKEKLFMEFEEAVLAAVTDLVDEDADVHIEEAEICPVGDDYVKDGITIIPSDMQDRPFPVVGLYPYYREFFANSMHAETLTEAIECVAHEIVSYIMELWEDPPECPYCAAEQEE